MKDESLRRKHREELIERESLRGHLGERFSEASFRRSHGGGIIEKESQRAYSRRNHEGGVIEAGSLLKNH